MIIDGRSIAAEIYLATKKRVASLPRAPRLGIITCAPNVETRQYLELKKKKAEDVGIQLSIRELDGTTSTDEVIQNIKGMHELVDGIVVQLPLPSHINREVVLTSVPVEKDPDGFSYPNAGSLLPPVVGAIEEISLRQDIVWEGKKVVIFGHGRLVGQPAEEYAKSRGSEVSIVTKDTTDARLFLQDADIIIAGAGVPHGITGDMVKSGAIIFDAGASEDGGVIVGDISPEVAEKASIFTPVPGGVGPITVALLLRNLVDIVEKK